MIDDAFKLTIDRLFPNPKDASSNFISGISTAFMAKTLNGGLFSGGGFRP